MGQDGQCPPQLFPNVININLEEKEVRAIWQINEKFYPIDGDGKVIDANFRTQEPILLIVGAGAPENLKRLLEAIKDDGDTYLQRIKVANFISQRRWNLIWMTSRRGLRSSFPRRILKTPGKIVKIKRDQGDS